MRDYYINWHHAVWCKYLDAFIQGDIKRLIIVSPPRHGKSELVSRRLPAYIFGKNPNAKIIAASYSSDLARLMNRDVQRIMDGSHYRALFPESKLNAENIRTVAHGNYLRNSEIFEIVGHSGQYRCAGVGGGITGMGADYAIIDDPIKNQADADSEVMRNNIWEWYTSTLYTRLERNDAILLTLTRWNEDDLAGRLLELALKDPRADKWTVVHLEAVKEEIDHEDDHREIGEPLWPDKYNLERLGRIRASAGSYVWNALFQGRPVAAGGNIWKRDWFMSYDMLPVIKERVVIAWDTAFKEKEQNDYSAATVWLESDRGYYLLEAYRDRLAYPELVKAMVYLHAKWKSDLVIVEDKASGQSAVQTLKRETKIPVIARKIDGDKVARAKAVTAHVEAGRVFLPKKAAWMHDYMNELMAFPNGRFDDWVDSTTLALAEMTAGAMDWQDEISFGTTMASNYEREMSHV
jgi:predicted phage terminase large subunit-like protein